MVEFFSDVSPGSRQHFEHRSIVTDEIDDKRSAQRIFYALVLQEMAHIEEIARMLAVESRDDFSAIDVGDETTRVSANPKASSTLEETARSSAGYTEPRRTGVTSIFNLSARLQRAAIVLSRCLPGGALRALSVPRVCSSVSLAQCALWQRR